jgi:transcriptional regulator with XRE-family HTH domain
MEPIDRRLLGARIRKAREHLGISQYKLGQHFSWDPLIVSRIEAGTRDLKISEIARLAEYLKVPIGYFLPEWFEESTGGSGAKKEIPIQPELASTQSPSISRIVGSLVIVVLVLVAGAFALRALQAKAPPLPGEGENYEDWLREIARPVMVQKVSPAIVRVMDCVDSKSGDCICNLTIIPDRADFMDEINQRKSQVPGNLGSLHTMLTDAVVKYQRLRTTIKSFCDRGASISDFDSLGNAVEQTAKARDKVVIKLQPYDR